MRTKDRVALVTGAGQGLGRAIAMVLAGEGAKIAVNDVKFNEQHAMETVQQIRQLGFEAEMFLADVSNEAEVDEMVQAVIKHFGRVDILVNNAGINRDGLVHKGDKTKWDAVMAVNLTGPFLCTKAVLPSMRNQGYGRIVNVSSYTARTGVFGTGYYATAKTGLIGLTKITAAENASKGVTVNAVAPGYIKTAMMLNYPEETKNAITSKIPVGRWAEPEEIANAILFLAEDKAGYVTGSVLDINGGIYL